MVTTRYKCRCKVCSPVFSVWHLLSGGKRLCLISRKITSFEWLALKIFLVKSYKVAVLISYFFWIVSFNENFHIKLHGRKDVDFIIGVILQDLIDLRLSVYVSFCVCDNRKSDKICIYLRNFIYLYKCLCIENNYLNSVWQQ